MSASSKRGLTRFPLRRAPVLAFTAVVAAAMALSSITASGQTLTLRAAQEASKPGRHTGTAVNSGDLGDTTYASTIPAQFNSVSCEWEMKMDAIETGDGVYNWVNADKCADWAASHSLKMRAHVLVWDSSTPAWVKNGNFTGVQLDNIMHSYIDTFIEHYHKRHPGIFYNIDVVNEVVNANGSFRSGVWSKIGTNPDDYVVKAFQYADAALTNDNEPSTRLFYNDWGNESYKSAAVLGFLNDWVARGAPIDGEGFEMHLNTSFSKSALSSALASSRAAGFLTAVTEVDVDLPDCSGASLATEANEYFAVTDACMRNAGCTSVTSWGFTDKYTWLGSSHCPLQYGTTYAKKPAYTAELDALEGLPYP